MKKTENGLPIVTQEQLIKLIKNGNKGVLVLGNVGIGKTWAFKNAGTYRFEKDFESIVNAFTANEIVAKYCSTTEGGIDGVKKLISYQLQGRLDIFIDDIGTEVEASHYGSKMDIIEWIILELYNKPIKMSFTTNLNLEGLTKRYGVRVIDRLKETCYIVVLEGEQRRSVAYENNQLELETLLS